MKSSGNTYEDESATPTTFHTGISLRHENCINYFSEIRDDPLQYKTKFLEMFPTLSIRGFTGNDKNVVLLLQLTTEAATTKIKTN